MNTKLNTEIKSIDNLNKNLVNSPQNAAPSFSIQSPTSDFQSNQQGVYDQLNQFLNEQDRQQKTVQETRDILGESASPLTDSQVYDLTNEIQYLVDTWLEEFEKKVFEGKTLKELVQIDV